MVVYDCGVKAAGIAERVMEQVEKAGVKAVVFDGVIPNPTNEVVEEAAPDLEPIDESAVQNDTRLGLAEAFLGVGDQESYKMIAEEIEAKIRAAVNVPSPQAKVAPTKAE